MMVVMMTVFVLCALRQVANEEQGKLATRLEMIEEALAASEEHLAQTRATLKTAEADRDSARERVKALEEKLERTTKELTETLANLVSTTSELEELKRTHDSDTKAAAAAAATAEATQARLVEEVKELKQFLSAAGTCQQEILLRFETGLRAFSLRVLRMTIVF